MKPRQNLRYVDRFERAVRVVLALQAGETITASWMHEHFGLSRAQAKRDMCEIERVLQVRRECGRLTLIRGQQ